MLDIVKTLVKTGAGWAQGSLGFLPRRRKLKVVMGKPMEVTFYEILNVLLFMVYFLNLTSSVS